MKIKYFNSPGNKGMFTLQVCLGLNCKYLFLHNNPLVYFCIKIFKPVILFKINIR